MHSDATPNETLRAWQTVLAHAQVARDDDLIKEAVRFIQEYGALLAEMLKERNQPDAK